MGEHSAHPPPSLADMPLCKKALSYCKEVPAILLRERITISTDSICPDRAGLSVFTCARQASTNQSTDDVRNSIVLSSMGFVRREV